MIQLPPNLKEIRNDSGLFVVFHCQNKVANFLLYHHTQEGADPQDKNLVNMTRSLPVAQWLKHPTGVRKVMGSILIRD